MGEANQYPGKGPVSRVVQSGSGVLSEAGRKPVGLPRKGRSGRLEVSDEWARAEGKAPMA